MKKAYITPTVEIYYIATSTIVANSQNFEMSDYYVDTSDGSDVVQLGRENPSTTSTPNIWEQGW